MTLSRRTATLLLVIGAYMLFTWTTRLYTWYSNDLQASPYAALIHFPIVLISLAIGGYLTYLGIKGRRATRRESRRSGSPESGSTPLRPE